MKSAVIQFILIGWLGVNLSAIADSPLTSTELSKAYIKAMENYSEVDEAIILADKAIAKNKNRSYTFNIIAALIKALKKLGSLNLSHSGWRSLTLDYCF